MSAPYSSLVEELSRVSRDLTHERKLLVGQSLAQGRELLRATAMSGAAWLGWEWTTPAKLALQLILPELVRAGERQADDFDLMATADTAVDAVEERGEAGPFAGTTGGGGYRDAIRRTLASLRAGGVSPALLARARPGDAKLRALATMLGEFEQRLREQRRLDGPEIMRRATRALDEGRARLPDARLFLLPGQSLRGTSGAFVRALLASAQVTRLRADPVAGLPVPAGIAWEDAAGDGGPLSTLHAPARSDQRPPLDLFAAATPADELREVLRRVVAARVPWDQVEILTTDPVTYGAALDALARRLDVPVTYARGLDSRRTRAGRAVESYLRWIGDDFPAEVLRQMLEAGDLASPATHQQVSGAALARRLRRLRVGWGRERYLEAVDHAIAAAAGPRVADEDEDPEATEERWQRERLELAALRALLHQLLGALPPAPGHLPDRNARGRASPAGIATGVLAFLQLVPRAPSVAESTIRKVLEDRLGRIRDTLTRPTGWEAAVGLVRTHLVTRVAPAGEKGFAPWTSTGGHLYLSDISTGGLSLRPHTFVVGMDATRVAGSPGTDPLLSDADRLAIAAGSPEPVPPIATSGERLEEARHSLAATLARLRGSVTLSYSAWESTEGRSISPAPELLQALRLREGDETLTYEALRRAIGSLAAAVPAGAGRLDGDDVWLGAIAHGRVLRSGTGVVRSVFGGLDAGLTAREARRSARATEYDGILAPAAELDPLNSDTVFSASRLEALGTCPRRYFYRNVLRVSPPEDPILDPDAWLDAARRGSLLHAVYERTLTLARQREIDYAAAAFAALALECLEAEADRELKHSPAPSQAVHDQERADLRVEVLTWVEMIRRDPPEWIAAELRFGPGQREAAVQLPAGLLRLRGAIDRVDRLPHGALRIVDYKTGGSSRYRPRQPFAGGRRIQHLLYTLAAEQILEEEVERMEYHFPTRKGEMRVLRFGRDSLARGWQVLQSLLEIAASGYFVTTEDTSDCRYCDFASVCRVSDQGYGTMKGERVLWAKEVGMGLPEYARLAELRGIDG